jgi:hypothetical protein
VIFLKHNVYANIMPFAKQCYSWRVLTIRNYDSRYLVGNIQKFLVITRRILALCKHLHNKIGQFAVKQQNQRMTYLDAQLSAGLQKNFVFDIKLNFRQLSNFVRIIAFFRVVQPFLLSLPSYRPNVF